MCGWQSKLCFLIPFYQGLHSSEAEHQSRKLGVMSSILTGGIISTILSFRGVVSCQVFWSVFSISLCSGFGTLTVIFRHTIFRPLITEPREGLPYSRTGDIRRERSPLPLGISPRDPLSVESVPRINHYRSSINGHTAVDQTKMLFYRVS